MTTKAAKASKRRKTRPVGLMVHRLVAPETGELVGCLVPSHPVDVRLMRERGYCVGTELRAELKKRRNLTAHRRAHALGGWLVDNVEAFGGLDSHGAIKRLQREADVCCETVQMDAAPIVQAVLAAAAAVLGAAAAQMLAAVLPQLQTIDVRVAQSLAFDGMDEGEFEVLWTGITGHLREQYATTMNQAAWDEVLGFIDREAGQ